MAKVWTVRATRNICREIPEGFTVQVTTAGSNIDWYLLERAIREQGLMQNSGGVFNAAYWEWI